MNKIIIALLITLAIGNAQLRYNAYTGKYENAPNYYQVRYNAYNNSYQYADPNAPIKYNAYNNNYYYDNYDTENTDY